MLSQPNYMFPVTNSIEVLETEAWQARGTKLKRGKPVTSVESAGKVGGMRHINEHFHSRGKSGVNFLSNGILQIFSKQNETG